MGVTETERLSGALKAGGYRQMRLAYDKRDKPPWTAELYIDGKLVSLRAGKSLQAAITAVQRAKP